MTTPRKTTPASEPTTPDSPREQVLGWVQLGIDTAASSQRQWNEISFAYGDLALQAARNGLSWLESMYEQNRKTLAALTQARNERTQAILDRLG